MPLTRDERFMKQCLQLASKARPSPNPAVGALVVKGAVKGAVRGAVKGGRIIGAGYHKRAGMPHAEVSAISAAQKKATSLKSTTMYVSLEPCCTTGKTAPCTDAIIRAGIGRVAVGCVDQNPAVAGRGIRALKKAGIEVAVGILEESCRKKNEAFFKHIRTGMPFVTLKNAMTLDGRIAARDGSSQWISGKESLRFAHHLRSQHDAVLVGTRTVLLDNPLLTCRLVKGKDPLRVVLDARLAIPITARVYADANVLVVTSTASLRVKQRLKQDALQKKGIGVLRVPAQQGRLDLRSVLAALGRRGIFSVLVEGGSRLNASLIREELADKLLFVIAPRILGNGISVVGDVGIRNIDRAINLRQMQISASGKDIVCEAYFSEACFSRAGKAMLRSKLNKQVLY